MCRRIGTAVAVRLAALLASSAPAAAQVQPYGSGDFGGFRSVLPPGSSGFDNLLSLVQYKLLGTRPAHNDDQLAQPVRPARARTGLRVVGDSQLLDRNIDSYLRGARRKPTLTDLINAMGSARTQDLRGVEVLPYALRVIGNSSDPALAKALGEAIVQAPAQVYPADEVCGAGDQMCSDSIRFRAIGAISQPLVEWVNRPTFQQAVEIQGHGPR